MKVYGIDFSSAPSKKKPIAVAECWLRGSVLESCSNNELRLSCFHSIESLDLFEEFLSQKGPWVGGFDLPFSMPRDLIEYFDWPTRWDTFTRFYCSLDKEVIKNFFIKWCSTKNYGEKFAYRSTDRASKSSPAMRWVNPPVAWMTHAGIERIRKAGLIFPAHQKNFNSMQEQKNINRFMMGDCNFDNRLAFEVYPALTARVVSTKSYKNDDKNKDSSVRVMIRKNIIKYLRYGKAGLSTKLKSSLELQNRMIMDCKGDYLDAAICALQAAEVIKIRNFGLPKNLDPLEGWIALS